MKSKSMKGGARIIPPYNKYVNSDETKPKEQKEQKESKQTYDEYKQKLSYVYPSESFPIPHPNKPTTQDYFVPYKFNEYNVPTIKRYNISIQGLNGNLISANQIFEDILPESNIGVNRMTSLSERLTLHSYIRSVLIKRGDGEQISFQDSKTELMNLLSYMKILEINPYHFSRITNNIYKTLADNFVLFKSCYPISVDKKSNNISCSKDNIGANIRVYSLNVFDEVSYLVDDNYTRKIFSDVWREMLFYVFLREEVLKKKVCPHFPLLHTYYLTKNSSIDFDKIKGLKTNFDNQNDNNNQLRSSLYKNNENSYVSFDDPNTVTVDLAKMIKQGIKIDYVNISPVNPSTIRYNSNRVTVNDKTVDANMKTDKCVVMITESPNINIIDWCTKTYVVDDGPIKKQIYTGHHSFLTWKSILFQLYISFLTLLSKRVVIREFSWSKNVYLKTFDDTGPVGFWKYDVNGYEFFIPNVKAIVMIDSNYDNVLNGYKGNNDDLYNFKIIADFYNTNKTLKDLGHKLFLSNEVSRELFEEMRDGFFDINVFDSQFKLYGGVIPDDNIREIIIQLKQVDVSNTDNQMEKLITLFGDFLHNKIGTVVDVNDIQQLHNDGYRIDECKTGDLIAINIGTDTDVYEWAIFIGPVTSGAFKILKRNNESHLGTNIPYYTVEKFYTQIRKPFGNIKQEFKVDSKSLPNDEQIEKYTLNYSI